MKPWLLVAMLLVGCASAPPLPRLAGARVNVDTRLSWIQISNANTLPRYEVSDVSALDEGQSGGRVVVEVTVLDELGRPCFGCRVEFNTSDLQNQAVQTTSNGFTDFPQSPDSSFAPERGERGPYFVRVWGEPSDTVSGMGLPLKRHWVYLLRFQRVVTAGPAVSTVTPPAAPGVTVPVGGCDVLPISGVRICR